MKHFAVKYCSELIVLICFLLLLSTKKTYNQWDRIINSDGKGYYAYLPAIFIYHDLEYNFVEYYENKYYPSDKKAFKEFRSEYKGKKLNKYFSGVAILWLPFFFIAHLLSFLLGYETDGYSILYQYSIGIAALFYLWIGCKVLVRLLKKLNVSEVTAAYIICSIVFGTNLFYYSIYDPSLTHVYNFTLITCFTLFIYNAFESHHRKWIIASVTVLALIIAVRPQNGIIIFLVPFIAGSFLNLKILFSQIFSNSKTLLLSLICAGGILLVPVILWYLQTGYFLVYSYGEERFYFSDPHLIDILFSYNKGWFIYTPLAFLSMFGITFLFRNNKFKFFMILLFLFIVTYILSSWWCWWYGSSFGLRPYIDFYVVIAILLGIIFMHLKQSIYRTYIFSFIIFLLIGLNLFQIYQHIKFILPANNVTSEIYWKNFLKLVPEAKVDIPENNIIQKTEVFFDMEGDSIVHPTITNEKAFSGPFSSKINKAQPYSLSIIKEIQSVVYSSKAKIKVSAMVYADSWTLESRLVIDFGLDGQSYSYHAFNLNEFLLKNKWTHIEFAIDIPELKSDYNSVNIYFWNPSSFETVFIDDMKAEFISLKEEITEENKIPAIKLINKLR